MTSTGSPFRFDGRVALVTGAGRGIGAAVATRLAQGGARVVLANRTLDAATQLAAELTGQGLQAQAIGFDAGRDGCRAAVAHTVDAYGGLDILVHNAGHCPWQSLDDLTADTLEQTLALNLNACFWLTQAALPSLKASSAARILVTSSVTGPRVAMMDSAHYAAAKAGVNGFIRSAALELARHRITVNGVEPGFVAKATGRLSDPARRDALVAQIPLASAGLPDDVAWAMVYLASEQARWVTGQTLVVDGGMTLPESGQVMDELHGRLP